MPKAAGAPETHKYRSEDIEMQCGGTSSMSDLCFLPKSSLPAPSGGAWKLNRNTNNCPVPWILNKERGCSNASPWSVSSTGGCHAVRFLSENSSIFGATPYRLPNLIIVYPFEPVHCSADRSELLSRCAAAVSYHVCAAPSQIFVESKGAFALLRC